MYLNIGILLLVAVLVWGLTGYDKSVTGESKRGCHFERSLRCVAVVFLSVVLLWVLENPGLAIISAGTLCLAQPKVVTYGNEVQNAQLSISVSNSMATAGSKIALYTLIQNESTNIVFIDPTTSKTFYLTNSSGKVFYLMPVDNHKPHETFLSNIKPLPQPIKPKETKKEVAVLIIGKDVDVGNYDLIELRSVTIGDGKIYALKSNLFLRIYPSNRRIFGCAFLFGFGSSRSQPDGRRGKGSTRRQAPARARRQPCV